MSVSIHIDVYKSDSLVTFFIPLSFLEKKKMGWLVYF